MARTADHGLAFAAFLKLASLVLFYNAYTISGFESLSAPGAIPMATTLVMAVTAILVAVRTVRAKADAGSRFVVDIMPARIAIVALMLIIYAFALKPVGFLPTSAVFLILTIKYLGKRSWLFSAGIGLLSLFVIYLIFRIVFTVLMPAGIVPEGEMLAWVRALISGGK